MLIQDILRGALIYLGKEDIADYIDDGGTPGGEDAEVVNTLMYCINAVEDELARYYFPLKYTEKLTSDGNNIFNFSSFSRTPVKILHVKSKGREIEYELQTNCLVAKAAEIEITYFYAPKRKLLDGRSEFGDMGDGKITALGAAAEYCLVCGEVSMAEVLETRYREAIDRARKNLDKGVYIPPRRWV